MTKRTRGRRKSIALPDEQIAPHAKAFGRLFNARRIQALFTLRALAQRIDDDYNTWLAPFGLTASQLSYLATLFSAEGHALPLTALSERIRTSNANVSVMIDTLERAGYVKRRQHLTDRRYTMAVLTPKGHALIARTFPEHLRNVQRALRHVTRAELDELVDVLGRIGEGFDEVVADC